MMKYGLLVLLSFVVSLLITAYMARGKVNDVPDHRSSHDKPTPTSGGLGVVIAVLSTVGCAVLMFYDIFEFKFIGGVCLLGAIIAGLGLWDDAQVLGAKFKFAIIAALAVAVPYFTGIPTGLPLTPDSTLALPIIMSWAGAALWVFVVVNLTNFMDGSNGLMGSVMISAFVGLLAFSVFAVSASIAIISLVMVAALYGFLAFNYRHVARVFCGDVGSLFIGLVFAMCALRLAAISELPAGSPLSYIYVGPMVFLPFLTDGLMTLLVRAKKGYPLLEAHRDHLYQKAIQAGYGHLAVAKSYIFMSWVCLGVAIAGQAFGVLSYMFMLAAMIMCAVLLYILMYRKLTSKLPEWR